MSDGPASSMNEECIVSATDGLAPVISTLPSIRGETGEPISVVIAEVVCLENEESDLFAGLSAFIRAGVPEGKAVTDIALEKLLRELSLKGRKLGADAILSANIKLLRGMHTAGHKLLKMTATGTAVRMPHRQD